jgi:hypothetical protein
MTPSGAETPAFDTTQTAVQPSLQPATQTPSHRRRTALVATLSVIGICVVAGVGYAYVQYAHLFSHAPYTDVTLLRGLLEHSAMIDSATYRAEGSVVMEPRDADARPYVPEVSADRQAYLEAFKRDGVRMKSVQTLLTLLAMHPPYMEQLSDPTLAQIVSDANASGRYKLDDASYQDPATGQSYDFRSVNNGHDYVLTITFETDDAISAIRESFQYNATTTAIVDKTVTFTNDSTRYYYLPSEPAKPFLVALSDEARMLPPELNASLAVSATTDLRNADADWEFAVDTMLDMGDMSYKIAFDARKLARDYYVRIRNMPGLYLMMLGIQKDTWVTISPNEYAQSTTSDHSVLSMLKDELPKVESDYKQEREQFTAFLQKLVTFAEEGHLIKLNTAPVREDVDGRSLYRYDIHINKDAIVPFVRKMIDEASTNEAVKNTGLFNDTALLTYLESDEFGQLFDYLDANTSLVIYVDPAGYLAGVTYGMRLVPPDTAVQLKDKQAHLTLSLTLNDINQPLHVEVPEDAVPLQQVIDENTQNLDYSRSTLAPAALNLTANSFYGLLGFAKLLGEQSR